MPCDLWTQICNECGVHGLPYAGSVIDLGFSRIVPTVAQQIHLLPLPLNPAFPFSPQNPSLLFHAEEYMSCRSLGTTMASMSPSRVSPSNADSPRSHPAKRPQKDGDDENRRKTPKVSRACDNCKRKKIRCDGTLPCKHCAKRNISCAYDAKYARGRPPTPPAATPINERQYSLRYELSISEQRPPAANDTSSLQVHSRVSPDADIEGQCFDPTSGLNFLHRAWKKLMIQKDESASYDSNDAGRHQLLTSAGDPPFRVEIDASDDFIPDAPTARNLLQFYFETCVVTYRMFHRQTVEGWMEMFLKDREERRSIAWSLGNPRAAILLTIMAIATLRLERINEETSTEDESPDVHRSDQLFCAGTKLTDMEVGFPHLESAQARLIQVLYLLQTYRMNKGWYTFGNVFHITLSLGMHRRRDKKRDCPFTSRRQNYITSECYKRTFWAAYIIDKYLSVVFGRPRLYQDEDIDQNFPDRVNDEEMTAEGPSISDDPADCYIDALISHAKCITLLTTMA